MAATCVDHISWCSSPVGEFDWKEAYNLACVVHDSHLYESFMGNWVWKTIALPKIKCFLWQGSHKSIPAREVLDARGLVPISCPLCNAEVESIIHILRDCPLAKEFWNSFPIPIHSCTFYGTNLLDWLRINCTNYQVAVSGISWSILFPFGVWCLWLRRNIVIFRNAKVQKSLKEETLAKASEFAFLGLNEMLQCTLAVIQVQWYPPQMIGLS